MEKGRRDDSLQRIIEDSWGRCATTLAVDDASPTIQIPGDFDPGAELVSRSRSALDGLTELDESVSVALSVADSRCRMLATSFTNSAMRETFESLGIVPGVVCSEELFGTTGVGLSHRYKLAVDTRGPDHYLNALKGMSCSAAPISLGNSRGLVQICSADDVPMSYLRLLRDMVRGAVESDLRRFVEGDTRVFENTGDTVLIFGELGTGKSRMALSLLDGTDYVVHNAVDATALGGNLWIRRVIADLRTDRRPILLEDIDLLGESQLRLITRALAATNSGWPRQVVATATPDLISQYGDGIAGPLVELFDHRYELTPLRMRRDEIGRIANAILAEVRQSDSVRLTREAIEILTRQPWPGNIRELRRALEIVAGKRSAGDIAAADLPDEYRARSRQIRILAPRDQRMHEAERDEIIRALREAEGNKSQAARELGMSRSNFYNRLAALGIHGAIASSDQTPSVGS
ncbi:AAA-type ATPase lid domain-containing protein [Gordonia sp. MP11Mi]|uniref:helix-turn-helix domain-containing protein n=1 Tax=Gordonia sp. MP11Mi TaxID=3022769 RepID=UPI003B21DD9D